MKTTKLHIDRFKKLNEPQHKRHEENYSMPHHNHKLFKLLTAAREKGKLYTKKQRSG